VTPELAEFFRKAQADSRKGAEVGKRLLRSRVSLAWSWRFSSCSCRTRRMPAKFSPSAVSAQISCSRSMSRRD
jgi:hypothetical protein